MSDIRIFLAGGFFFLAALEAAELGIGYSLSDKLKDIFQSVEKRIVGLKSKAAVLVSKAEVLTKKAL